MAQKKSPLEKVIWAVDPFIKERGLQLSALKAFEALSMGARAEIEPVFILNLSSMGVPAGVPPEVVERTRVAAERRVGSVVKDSGLASVAPVKVLAGNFQGRSGETRELLRYAGEQNASLIVLSTHARKGLGRWVAGSFAETLMLSSPIPLLTVNPAWKAKASFKSVIFPTDFTPESRHAFRAVLKKVRESAGTVTVFHHLPYLAGPEVEAALKASPSYQRMVQAILEDCENKAKRLVQAAEKSGVKAKVVIDYKTVGSDAVAILKQLQGAPSLVIMTARAGQVTSTILGSTARQVVRCAEVPVWVIHVNHERKSEEPLFNLTQEDLDLNLINHESPGA